LVVPKTKREKERNQKEKKIKTLRAITAGSINFLHFGGLYK